LRRLRQVIELVFKEIEQDVVLAPEVVIQRGFAKTSPFRDLLHGGFVESLFQKDIDDLVKDLMAADRQVFFGERDAFGHEGLHNWLDRIRATDRRFNYSESRPL